MDITSMILLALAYPFIAAWMLCTGIRHRLHTLEHEVDALRTEVLARTSQPPPQAQWQETPAPQPAAEPQPDIPVRPETPAPDENALAELADALSESVEALPPERTPPRWLVAARTWLLTGNLVAKLGLAILFVGVGFLLKYVAETVVIPIELRLAGVVLADLALLGWGWRMRGKRREIGLPIQGTAIAILMLVVFGASHRYALLPDGFAFTLLVLLTAFTCLLAVLQNAPWLAAFGITGGFLCPLMISSGEGNHIALFAYYALLNAGVFALAITRAWRPLNLLGFGFTFIVGSAWGGLRYTSANYGSAQGFLILFFLMYVGIAIAFARQQQTRLKHYVDASLVLGTPLLAFGLQAALVRDKPFGLALSALALGGFYLMLALFLMRRGRERWRVLVETFTALGAIFGTLAIPFAVDARWTSAAWALEGAGFVWFGLRRAQPSTWIFGLLLQTGAWLSFIGAAVGLAPDAAGDASLGLGFVLLAGSAFAMARSFHLHAADSDPVLGRIANWSITIAAFWLLGGTWAEAILHTGGSLLANLLAAGALLTAALLYITSARMAWPRARRLALLVQLAGALAMAVAWGHGALWGSAAGIDAHGPLLGAMMISLAALATSHMMDKAPSAFSAERLPGAMLIWGGVWWFGPVVFIAADRLVDYLPDVLGGVHSGIELLSAAGITMSAVFCLRLARRLSWPRLRWLGASTWGMLALLTSSALGTLYADRVLPYAATWLAWAILWVGSEHVLSRLDAEGTPIQGKLLRAVHALRSAGPWLALWPAGGILIDRWLAGSTSADELAAQGHWAISSAWGNYLPTWAMMLALGWLLKRSSIGAWPTAPLQDWYRRVVIPAGALLVLLLAGLWNLLQDGAMAPLPYLPLLNPLDLTTGFALVLCVGAAKGLMQESGKRDRLMQNFQAGGISAAWIWLNLILLRSAAQYLGIAYQLQDLAASQFVQAMLSLVWSASALVLMRFAARRAMRRTWRTGAVLLGIVLIKLIAVDAANGGSMARIVAFVGVGLLMLLVGYLAPYPKSDLNTAGPERTT